MNIAAHLNPARRLAAHLVIAVIIGSLAGCGEDSDSTTEAPPAAAGGERASPGEPAGVEGAGPDEGAVPVAADLEDYPRHTRAQLEAAIEKVKANRRDPGAWLDLGMLYHAHLEFVPARECYERLVDLTGGDARGWYFLAIVQDRLGKPDDALQAIDRAAELAPEFAPVHWREALWRLNAGDLGGAEAAARRSVEAQPRTREGRLLLARALLQQNRADEAMNILQQLVDEAPQDAYAAFLLGTAFRRAGRLEEAAAFIDRGDPDPPRWADAWIVDVWALQTGSDSDYRRARERREAGQPQEALAILEEAIRRYHDRPALRLERASILRLLGRLDDAIAELEDVQSRHLDDYRVSFQLAGAYRENAQRASPEQRGALLETALEHADRCLVLNETFALGHSMRGDILLLMERYDESADEHRIARSINPDNPLFARRLGAVLCAAGRYAEAVEPLRDSYRLDRRSEETAILLGAALANSGQLEAALELVEEARSRLQDPRLDQLLRQILAAREQGTGQ